MEKYEQISVVGEGSYGIVMKCRHKESDQVVAIKKFLETEEDATVRRMALREIRMLKRLKHENLVAMIEVFRHRKRFYLVFEFLEGTVLDELEKMPNGLGDERSRERIYQVVRAINYCHSNHIIHRDVKPENVLVSSLGVVKLCDFGFARLVSISGEPCTEYVATRWYRAPELLVGEVNYSGPVDIWAIGCLFAEMMSGDPLFPGDSDIDQLYHIVRMLGKPCGRHQQLMAKSSQLRAIIKPSGALPPPPPPPKASDELARLEKAFPDWPELALHFLASCVRMDPSERSASDELVKSAYFQHDRFPAKFLPILRERVNAEFNANPLLRKHKTEILMATDKKEALNRVKVAPNEPIRWKFTVTEPGGVKRKFNYEIFNENSKDNLISLAKTSQRLSVVQRGGNRPVIRGDMEALERFGQETVDNEQEKVLHPSINNISFNREQQQAKKSPKNSVPQRAQFLKKIDRNVVEQVFSGEAQSWLHNFGASSQKSGLGRRDGRKSDVFTLPNLPGVGSSPHRGGKKAADSGLQSNITVTPAYRYKKSKRKLNILDISLPLIVKDNGRFY